MVIDVELEVVSLDDCSQRGELLLRSVDEREADGEVHLALTQPTRLHRPFKTGNDNLAEDLESLSQPHSA